MNPSLFCRNERCELLVIPLGAIIEQFSSVFILNVIVMQSHCPIVGSGAKKKRDREREREREREKRKEKREKRKEKREKRKEKEKQKEKEKEKEKQRERNNIRRDTAERNTCSKQRMSKRL